MRLVAAGVSVWSLARNTRRPREGAAPPNGTCDACMHTCRTLLGEELCSCSVEHATSVRHTRVSRRRAVSRRLTVPGRRDTCW